MRKPLFFLFAFLMWAGLASARADVVTLDLSATMQSQPGYAACLSGGCSLSGQLVFDNTTGSILGFGATLNNSNPGMDGFSNIVSVTGGDSSTGSAYTYSHLKVQGNDSWLELQFYTPTAGSLVGYDGGDLDFSGASVTYYWFDSATHDEYVGIWNSNGGSFTPESQPAATPEPSSLLLFGSGLLCMAAAFVRRASVGRA